MSRARSIALVVVTPLALVAPAGAARAQYLVQGLDGPVTPAEVQAFKAHMKARLADTSGDGPFNAFVGNRGNNYVYGQSGGALEGLISLYEAVKDQEVMDQMIWFADQMLAHRNDRRARAGRARSCPSRSSPAPSFAAGAAELQPAPSLRSPRRGETGSRTPATHRPPASSPKAR
jgi:hypothetical protein